MKKHILSVHVQNRPGVLANIASMFAARGFNIDSLVVGRTEESAFSRMVIVCTADETTMEQVRKQLGKIVPVVKVQDLSEQECIERDLLLIRVYCPPEKRGELRQITEIFRGSVVDVASRSVVIQLTGPEKKIEAFVELCRPYGIKNLSRTGVIAVPRASQPGNNASTQTQRRARPRSATATTSDTAAVLPPS